MQQSLKPNEIIVSNDCSTDDTRAILDRLSRECTILRVLNQEANLGMVLNTNTCLKAAKHEFVVKLDSDDYLLPTYIEVLANMLNQYPDAGYAHGAVQEINERGEKIKLRKLFRQTGFQPSSEALRASCSGYKVAANIIMFRKAALEAAGFITSRVKFAEDFYLSVEIANAGFGNVYINEVLSCYRVWADGGNVRQKRKLNEINGVRIIFDEPLKSAFNKRNWDLGLLNKKKEQFACMQSDCLTWTIYSPEEKQELEEAIYKLSSTQKVKMYTFLYKNGLGSIITIPNNLLGKAVQLVKQLVVLK